MSGPPYSDRPGEAGKPASFRPAPNPVPAPTLPLYTDGAREQATQGEGLRDYQGATLDFLDREIRRLTTEVEIMEVQEKIREHATALLALHRRWGELLLTREQN